MYQVWRIVKKRHMIQLRQKMIDGILKMEADIEKGMTYSSGIQIEGDEK
jgi:hypothetical protein